ncbi:hypothetical protein CERSUDRAFT_127014 [Gelatoporia subvermispora B]|uniref:C2H2-type domain-containing protein n=1 Tax=Ceriporiopsis subvermispora (strain B) TaxID=914234 RepID=M2Q5M7_CERS8|nr:hypothetical protein CERSUDRAFT_127014 [Gelatoporia subvermispora B]
MASQNNRFGHFTYGATDHYYPPVPQPVQNVLGVPPPPGYDSHVGSYYPHSQGAAPPFATRFPSEPVVSGHRHYHDEYTTTSLREAQPLQLGDIVHEQEMYFELCDDELELLYPDEPPQPTSSNPMPSTDPASGYTPTVPSQSFYTPPLNVAQRVIETVTSSSPSSRNTASVSSGRNQEMTSGSTHAFNPVNSVHIKPGRYYCSLCKVDMDNNRRTRERHDNTVKHCARMDSVRSEPYKCGKCLSSFGREDVLLRHQRAKGH